MADPLEEISEAGWGVERERRREQAAAEADALQLHRLSRTLVEVVWEAMQRGGRVRLGWPGGEAAGVPVAAVGDLVVLPTDQGQVGVNLLAVSSVSVASERGEGWSGDRTVVTFLAWARMLEGRSVRVGLLGGGWVEGTLLAVAADHLLLRTRSGDETALSLTAVAAVSVAGDGFVG